MEVNDLLSDEQRKQVNEAIGMYCDVLEGGFAPDMPEPAGGAIEDKRDAASTLACMVVYARAIHLRDRERQEPVYRKYIPRLDETVDVFDEVLVMRTLLFHEKPRVLKQIGRRHDYTDLQLVYPPKTRLTPHFLDRVTGSGTTLPPIASLVEHYERQPEILWQGAFSMVNCFRRGWEYVGSLIEFDCDRLVLVADLTALPTPPEKLFRVGEEPTGVLLRDMSDMRLPMPVERSSTGVFILDSAKAFPDGNPQLLKDDKYEIHFPIDWDAVAKSA